LCAGASIAFIMLGIFLFSKHPTFRPYVKLKVDKSVTPQIVSNVLQTTKLIKTLPDNSTAGTNQSHCTYSENVTVYMDAFEEVSLHYFGKRYQEFMDTSRQCEPFPGGGQCFFNNNNKSSDAIFYYGSYTKLKYSRVFDGQIVVVSTREAENGPFCSLPSPDKYDFKVSYRRDSAITWAMFCQYTPRLTEMGQPDVPVGREKLVAGFISDCKIKWRQDYIAELIKYIHIDQWGRCFRNTPGDFWKTHAGDSYEAKMKFLKENPYKFVIAFENTPVDRDYVTEKIYHGYLTHTIPIYYGDKSVFDFVPANTSFVYANNYTPEELAKLIKRVGSNDTLYSEYFKNWDLTKVHKLYKQYCSKHFICATCRKVWNILYNRKCGN